MWFEAGLSWKDFLLEDEDVNKFITEQVLKAKHSKSKIIIMVVVAVVGVKHLHCTCLLEMYFS